MTKHSPFRYFKTSEEIVRLAVMMYVRFPLSLRNVEDLLHERGIDVSHETVRFWWHRFGPMFAGEIRKRRVAGMRSSDQHVISITQIHMGTADNVIAETAKIRGTVRSLSREARALGKARMVEICRGIADLTGARVELDYIDDLPVTHNDVDQTVVALKAATGIAESVAVLGNRTPSMGGEDFSYMLEARPGAFMFLGNGDTAPVHNPKYDFNDAAIPYGCAFFVSLVQNELGLDQ